MVIHPFKYSCSISQKKTIAKIIEKLGSLLNLLLQMSILDHPSLRLKSNSSYDVQKHTKRLVYERDDRIYQKLAIETRLKSRPQKFLVGILRTTINRIRTGQGRYKYLLHKQDMVNSPLCQYSRSRTQWNHILAQSLKKACKT